MHVVQQPAIKIVDKLVERKVRTVNMYEFTEERKMILIRMVADEVLASLSRLNEAERVPSSAR